MGSLSAQRLLDSLSMAEWQEWKEYVKVRGPIGLDRWDFMVKRLIFANGAPNWGEKIPTIDDLRMPWDDEPVVAEPTKAERRAFHDAAFGSRAASAETSSIVVPPSRRVRTPGVGFGSVPAA